MDVVQRWLLTGNHRTVCVSDGLLELVPLYRPDTRVDLVEDIAEEQIALQPGCSRLFHRTRIEKVNWKPVRTNDLGARGANKIRAAIVSFVVKDQEPRAHAAISLCRVS